MNQILHNMLAKLNKRRQKLAETKNAGFTMVEMVVVIVVITIVAGLTVSGIIAWQDWARFKKENETAQTLFIAAQNQLSEYGANGRLDDLVADLENGGSGLEKIDVANLKSEDGSDYDLDTLFPESAGKGASDDEKKKYRDDIYALVVEKGQFDTYLSDPAGLKSTDLGAYYACELLGSYVYDTSILNEGAFVVEMTTSGQVFSVIYSDRNDSFFYGAKEGGGDGNGSANISNREESYRQDRMIGYYGVDSLYKMLNGVSNAMASANLRNVRLHNEDTFYLTYDVEQTVAQSMTYTIKLYDSKKGQKGAGTQALSLELDGTKLKAGESNAQNISCKVTRGDSSNAEEIGEFPVLAYVENDKDILKSVPKGYIRVHVLLDAADVQATTYLYDTELADIHSNKASQTKFAKTYSIFRFGMDLTTGRVNASVSAKADGYVPIPDTYNTFLQTQSDKNVYYATKNAYFSVGTITEAKAGDTYDFTLKNARHLYNVRYFEDITYDQQAGKYNKKNGNNGNNGNNSNKNGIKAVNFKLAKDIDWAKFQEDGGLYDTYKATGYVDLSNLNKAKGKNVTRYNCDFPSINQLRSNDTFVGTGTFGKIYTISGIQVTEISNAVYGLYLISDKNSASPTVADMRPTGLFNVNYGTIQDVNLDQIKAAGSNMVGGFCGVNAGKCDRLTTLNTNDASVISGLKNVGGIMGFQLPVSETMVIENLVNRANVQGVQAVGGIVGMIRNDFDNIDLKEMRGLSQASLGQMKKNAVKVSVRKCTNYGTVSGVNSADLKGIYEANTGETKKQLTTDQEKAEEPRYIGGIAGYTYNSDKDSTDKIKIEECVSSPQYSKQKLNSILSSDTNLQKALKGVYVGGIVGFNHYGQINGCQAKAEKNTDGYLFGYKFVGGIVGFNMGPASGVVGTNSGKAGLNENHVVAYDFAGGIVGCNAGIKDEDSLGNSLKKKTGLFSSTIDFDPNEVKGLLVPEFARALDVKIDNWTNKGVVVATHEFAGGIAGMNSGWIYRCNSELDVKDADAYFDKVHSGDYAGGIAGYNNGIIGNTSRTNYQGLLTGIWYSTANTSQGALHSVCYVRGHSYVGGIVGYNDVNAIVEDYDVSGGYIIGEDRVDADNNNDPSCFVGGYAGFNASLDLLTNGSNSKARLISSNPNLVSGTYFVGGNIGGNIVSDTETWNAGTYFSHIETVFKTDNFLGELEGKAFVGGFVGYNMVVHDVNLTSANGNNSFYGQPFKTQMAIVDAFKTSEQKGLSNDEALKDKVDILDHLSDYYKYTKATQYIRFTGNGDDYTQNSFGTITAEIYVGGVLGYNNADTELYVQNVENATPIIATNAILNADEQKDRDTDYLGRDFKYTYSYAGGIIGKVSKNAEINNCKNAPSGTVETLGTYTGGLCEINEGTIINCTIGNFGNTYTDYLGGLCGLNKETGVIKKCTFENGKTVSGRNVVGGVAAENFGTISEMELIKPRMLVAGKTFTDGTKDGVTGLYAAYNAGTIRLEKDIEGVTIESGGRFVGAVAGINNGTIENKKTNVASAKVEANKANSLTIVGNITGYQAVGSLVGRNLDPNASHKVEYYMSHANVTATNGNAGGIIGENESSNTIQYCYNIGVVSAPNAGNAGGITSTNSGLIRYCVNYKEVSAPKGMCGGMVSVNLLGGKITQCKVCPEADGSTVSFTSSISVGGIAAQNAGFISDNELKGVIVRNKAGILGTNMGIIVGENLSSGEILILDKKQITDSKVLAVTNNCKLGGVSGANDGWIHGSTTTINQLAVVSPELELQGASYASMGGITGVNTGTIEYIAVDGTIDGKLGTATSGCGGIAGYSGYSTKDQLVAGQSAHGKTYPATITNCTFDGTVHVTGSAGSPTRGGGIVGINGNGSKIESCYLGVRAKNVDGAASTTTLVVAGDQSKGNGYKGNTTAPDTSSYSYLGGIAGENYGWVSACDNKTYSTETVKVIGFAGESGGIVGYNARYGKVSGYAENEGTDSEKRHMLTTGENWIVEMRSSENDRGPGGIIGMSISAESMEYVENYAYVNCWFKGNNKTGGLIGVIEQNNANKTLIRHCANYGKIEGYANACGLTSQVRASGIVFEYCYNYGDIESEYRYASGFCTYISSLNASQTMSFYHCENHGNIYCKGTDGSPNSAGFLGTVVTCESGVQFYFYDCVNTGIITFKDDAQNQTRAGSFVGTGGANITFQNCRNYNTHNSSVHGWVGTGGNVSYYDCLDDSGLVTDTTGKTPYGGSLNRAQNAYYLDTSSLDGAPYSTDNYGVYFDYVTYDSSINAQFNGVSLRNMQDNEKLFTPPSVVSRIQSLNKAYFPLYYDASSAGIDSFIICLANTDFHTLGASFANTITATYYYNDGSKQQVSGTATGTYELTDGARVVLQNPSSDKKPVGIGITCSTAASQTYMRGFLMKPAADTSVIAACPYVSQQFDTTFSIDHFTEKLSDGTNKSLGTNFNGKNFAVKSYAYMRNANDVLAIGAEKYKNYSIVTDTARDYVDITFDVDNQSDSETMDSFVFYLANDNTKDTAKATEIRTYYYDYSVTFIDENGNSVESAVVTEKPGYDCGVTNYMGLSRQEVQVPAGLTGKISTMILHVRNNYYEKTNAKGVTTKYYDSKGIYFRAFAWIPKATHTETVMAAGASANSTQYANMSTADSSNRPYLVRLYVDDATKTGTTPLVYAPYSKEVGFYMDYANNNPVSTTYYGDDSTNYEASLAMGLDSNSRIATYLDIDPKFPGFVAKTKETKRKLNTPVLTVTKQNGAYKVAWNAVQDAYEYEIFYTLSDFDTNQVVYTSSAQIVGSTQRVFNQDIDNLWATKHYKITFNVRAINAYHRVHGDATDTENYKTDFADYDSDLAQYSEYVEKKILPVPEAHLEIINGNRAVLVLDNYDEYVEEGCSDVTLEYKLNSEKVIHKLDVSEGKYSAPFILTTGSGNQDYTYYVYPNASLEAQYDISTKIKNLSQACTNDLLPSWKTYANTDLYYGFYGNDADAMEYIVAFKVAAGARDSYVTSDITAYDDGVGATVAYDHELTHVANAAGKTELRLTTTLKNLPIEWFSEDMVEHVVARTYLHHSQNDMVFYQHTVAEGVALDGDQTANVATLKAISDPYYFATSDTTNIPSGKASIYDDATGDLADGYVLYKNIDGTYDIVYNATLEMAKTNPSKSAGKEYMNYCVTYSVYDSMETNANTFSENSHDFSTSLNRADFMPSYWRYGIGSNYAFDGSFVKKGTDNYSQYLQEIAPAPQIETAVAGTNGGYDTYTFTWDTFFRDENSFDVSKDSYQSNQDTAKITNPTESYGLFATWDQLSDALGGAAGSNGYQYLNSNKSGKVRFMNAYYSLYSNATYRVDLIGTTIDGEETVLATQTVDTKTAKDDITGKVALNGTTPTTYKVWDYECTFTDTESKWNRYPKLTARVIRQSSMSSPKAYDYNSGNARTNNTPLAGKNSVMILPRYATKDITIKQRLQQLTCSVALGKDAMGNQRTDALVYDVSFGGITDAMMKKDLGGYLVTVETVKKAAGATDMTDKHYFYITDIVDGDALTAGETIDLDIDELEADGSVVTSMDGAGAFKKNGDQLTLSIDLEDFVTGETVNVSVQAIPHTGATTYTYSEPGIAQDLVIPPRLHVPDVDALELSPSFMPTYDDASIECANTNAADLAVGPTTIVDNTVDLVTYQKGFAFQYKDTAGTFDEAATAKIKMAIAVFDEKVEADNKVRVASGDSADGTGNKWNSGADTTIYTKTSAADLGYVSNETEFVLKLTDYEQYEGQFAGKWLKVALIATDNTKIDSQWTDNDAADASVNYKWIHIPKLYMDDIDSSVGDDVKRYMKGSSIMDDQPADMTGVTEISSATIRFEEMRGVDGYSFRVIGVENADSVMVSGVAQSYTKIIDYYLQKRVDSVTDEWDGTWDVYARAADGYTQITGLGLAVGDLLPGEDASNPNAKHVVECKQNTQAVYLGNIGTALVDLSATPVTPTAQEQIVTLGQFATAMPGGANLNMQLRYNYQTGDKAGTFALVLPAPSDAGAYLNDAYKGVEMVGISYYMDAAADAASAKQAVAGNSAVFVRSKTATEWQLNKTAKDATDYAQWMTDTTPVVNDTYIPENLALNPEEESQQKAKDSAENKGNNASEKQRKEDKQVSGNSAN